MLSVRQTEAQGVNTYLESAKFALWAEQDDLIHSLEILRVGQKSEQDQMGTKWQ